MSSPSVNAGAPSAPFLSICIPTFNRENYLRECLDSLKNTLKPGVEIVVSDNASTDGTLAMLEEYALQLPLRWRRNETNLGFDRNLAAVVSMAQGRYCWLLGSDDCVAPGALAKVMDQLRLHNPDILHFGYVQGDIAMRPLSQAAPLASISPVVMTPSELPRYLGSLPNVSLLFAFISSFIFRRDRWVTQTDRLEGWFDSHYVHAYMLHAMLASGASVLSSNDCHVTARGGNPNEHNSSAGRMLALDAITLERIHREIYREESHRLALGKVFRRSYNVRTIISIASQGGIPQLIRCYSSLKVLGLSVPLLRFLQVANWFGLMPIFRRLITMRSRTKNMFVFIQSGLKK